MLDVLLFAIVHYYVYNIWVILSEVWIREYIPAKESSQKREIFEHRVFFLYVHKRLDGVQRQDMEWTIYQRAEKPADGRKRKV